VNASLKLGAASALTAGAFQAFSGNGFLTRVAGNGVAGGTSSKFLGGSFQRGAILAALTVTASELVTRVTSARPTFKTASGSVRVKPSQRLIDRLAKGGRNLCAELDCDITAGGPNAGRLVRGNFEALINKTIPEAVRIAAMGNKQFVVPGFFSFAENNPVLIFLAKVQPGVESASIFHDKLLGQLGREYSIFQNDFIVAATIPPAFAFDAVALGGLQIRDDVRLAEDR